VTIGNHSALVPSIMLHIKDKVNSYLLVALKWFCSLTQVLEGLVFMKLGHLKGSGILPLGVAIVLIKFNSMVVTTWDFIPKLVAWCHAIGPELGLVSHVEEPLVTLG